MTSIDRAIPFWQPQVGPREFELVAEVLRSGYLNDGPVTERFEHELARLLAVKHVVTTTSGTTALFAALVAAGIGPGDEVLVPDVTFIATANAVTLAGATPVLADVNPRSLLICPAAAARAITSRTRAIIPVHLSGRAAELCAIQELAAEHGLRIIEDAAEALGSRWTDGRALGAIGDAGCFSLSPNKIITTGQGGAVATNDDAIAARLRELKDQGRPTRGTGGDDLHVSVGYNLKFTSLQAAVGLAQLVELPGRQQRMAEIYHCYVQGLRDVARQVQLIGFVANELPLWIDAICDRRDELDAYLRSRGIHGRRFWHPLHAQPPYRRQACQFPNASTRAPQAFWLPSSFLLRDDDIDFICAQIRSFYATQPSWRAEAA